MILQKILSVTVDGHAYDTDLPEAEAGTHELQQILSIVFAVLGALAVLMIVLAGLRFITAQGNPQEVAKARNTIVYAVVGLIVAIMAEAIVSLVLGSNGLGG